MATRKLYALSVSVWDADDYLNDRNTNPRYTDHYLFGSEEEAKEYAMDIDYDASIYNDAMLFEHEVDEETILKLTGFETIEEFDEELAEPYTIAAYNCGHTSDQKTDLAKYVCDEDGFGDAIPCANYDFDASIDGAILVCWSWQRYVGYSRKCEEVRYAYHNETEKLLTKQDRTFVSQYDIVMTKEEVEQSQDLAADLTERLLERGDWRWTNPGFVESAIEDLAE